MRRDGHGEQFASAQLLTIKSGTASARRSSAGSLRSAVLLALGFGLLKFLVATLSQIAAQHAGYEIFRDELYFVVCGRHLA
jgi:hypothetical protein